MAQFDLSALRALHTIISPSDQSYLYSNSAKALVTARRRGDDRRLEYWSGNPVVSIEITPYVLIHYLRKVESPIDSYKVTVCSITDRTSRTRFVAAKRRY